MIKLYKEGEDINSSLQIGDILEVEPGVFIKVIDIIKETEEDFAGIKKLNIHLKGEVISNYATTRKATKGVRSRNN
jgi:hypothetical protein